MYYQNVDIEKFSQAQVWRLTMTMVVANNMEHIVWTVYLYKVVYYAIVVFFLLPLKSVLFHFEKRTY